ncbi:endonuclease/exonuclease/phosphatase family protein [Streptomyces decoyicus]|uniref:endonuclease/exonuclease/phosphatase family protein n=1 Tax=Streptomyces decoyicus TaxID=249567 RepID=UPI00386BBC99|nr:endonuclease/exonuclease/phosphatase family protein [Streptomyces decoyicus]
MRRWLVRALPLLAALLLSASALPASEAAAPGPDYTYATWNTQGGGPAKWNDGMAKLASDYDVVALEEAGGLNSFKAFVDAETNCRPPTHVPDPGSPGEQLEMLDCNWEIPGTEPRKQRRLFFAVTKWTSSDNNTRSLAFIVNTDEVPLPARGAFEYLPPRQDRDYYEGDRGLLRLKITGGPNVYAAHADASPLGRNLMSLVQKARGDSDRDPWLMMGDFNLAPRYVRPMIGEGNQPELVKSGKGTHGHNPGPEKECDYMVSNDVPGYTAERYPGRLQSDHFPVSFRR